MLTSKYLSMKSLLVVTYQNAQLLRCEKKIDEIEACSVSYALNEASKSGEPELYHTRTTNAPPAIQERLTQRTELSTALHFS